MYRQELHQKIFFCTVAVIWPTKQGDVLHVDVLGFSDCLSNHLLHVCEELLSKQGMLRNVTQGLQMMCIISTVNNL